MDVFDLDKLVLFIAFVIPGFVSLKTYEALGLGPPRETGQQLIDAIAYSCLNYAVLSVAIYSVEVSGFRSSLPWVYGAFWFFFLFVSPVGLTCAVWMLRHSRLVLNTLPHPVGKPWDFVFSKRRPYWIIVKLKDGSQIAGRYDSESFASNSPQPEQIYLEEAWHLNQDGGFERPRTDTAGIIVVGSEIVAIEFFQLTRREANGREKASSGGLSANGEEGVPTRAEFAIDSEAARRVPTGIGSSACEPASQETVKQQPST